MKPIQETLEYLLAQLSIGQIARGLEVREKTVERWRGGTKPHPGNQTLLRTLERKLRHEERNRE